MNFGIYHAGVCIENFTALNQKAGDKYAAQRYGKPCIVVESIVGSKIVANVVLELQELKKLGIRVTAAQLAYPLSHIKEIAEYDVNGMSISEIADLVRDIS